MAFETNEHVTRMVDQLMKLASTYDRGQTIPWTAIEAIVGPRDENKYITDKWRRRLEREREIVSLAAISTGIRLLTHKETAVEIPALRQRKAYRQIRRCIRQVSTVNEAVLTDHQRRQLAVQRTNLAQQRRDLFRSQRQLALSRATEVAPRRNVTINP